MSNHAISAPKEHHGLLVTPDQLRWLAWNGVILVVYWGVLAYSYVHSVSPVNGTDTFLYLRINSAKVMEGALWSAALLPTINTKWSRPSDIGMTILYFITLIPTIIIFGFSDQPRTSMYTMLAGYLSLYAACRAPIKIPHIRIKNQYKSSVYIATISVSFIFFWYVAKGHRSGFNINFNDIYDYRDQANSIFVGPIAYIAAWTPQVMNPFLFCYALMRKKWLLFAASFMFQIFCLVIFQEKTVFIPCVILPLFYVAPKERKGQIWFVLWLTATIIVCEIIYSVYNIPALMEIWTRRFFFVQQFLYFNYFEVFGKIGHVYYSDSFLRGLIHYPFPYPAAPMVAYYAWGTTSGSPNTGFFGSGYMELGQFGVILSGILAGLTLKLFDRVKPAKMPMWFFCVVAFQPFIALLVAQKVLTSMLTAGIFPLFLLMLGSRQLDDTRPAHKTERRLQATSLSANAEPRD